MSDEAAVWIRDFLSCRTLELPDGRELYAYRCTGQEFAALTETLKQSAPLGNHPGNAVIRAFVLYASEWWQRRYDGRRWAWEPLLASIGWYSVDYPDLYELKNAWRWWKVDLVRLPTSIRYLGTFACQGGLPLALVGDTGSRVTQYLRAVLNHAAAYRQFVDDPIDLARDQQHLLNPPMLRRDYVFRLAADLIEAVLDLQNDIESDSQDEDPLNALDQTRPDWRRTMPLALGDARAHSLLTGLLREAAQGRSSPSDEFRVERFLRRTDVGWRLGARIRLPASVSAVQLAHQLRVPAAALPPRLEMRLHVERVRVVGLYVRLSDDFRLAREARNATEVWGSEACGEIRLRCMAGGEVGEPIVPQRGSALGELPWAFRSGDDGAFIGEGSVSNRAPEIVVLVPDGCTLERLNPKAEASPVPGTAPAGEPDDRVQALSRTLRRISEPTAIDTGSGRCVIRPSSMHAAEEEHRLSGQRFHDLESAFPLFRDAPTLRVARTGQTPRAVPAGEVSWRQTGGDWRSRPDTPGLWEMRHLRDGELRHLGRAGILPARFDLTVEPGTDMGQGHLILTQAQGVRVAGVGQDAEAVEMGVDIGGLSAVVMNNAPPNSANYLQRAGRAGRRGEGVSFAVTLCPSSPHGEQVFNDPLWPFTSTMSVPRVALDSARLVQRHVNSLCLGAFLEGRDVRRLKTGWFFQEDESGSSPGGQFVEWCRADAEHDERLITGLNRLVRGTALATGETMRLLDTTADAMARSMGAWRREVDALRKDAAQFGGAEPESRAPALLAIERQLRRLEGEYLLAELANRQFLPGYGFPTGIVSFVPTTIDELKRRQRDREGRDESLGKRLGYPSRQMEMAIREYAPGAEIVMDGRVYESGGVTLNWHLRATCSTAVEA